MVELQPSKLYFRQGWSQTEPAVLPGFMSGSGLVPQLPGRRLDV